MSLIFGKLTNSFINFGQVGIASNFNTHNATFKAAADDFRTVAALDASYLTYIGIAMFVATYTYMVIWVGTGESCLHAVNLDLGDVHLIATFS